MEQYINKTALVSEIDRRLHQLTDASFDSMIGRNLIEIKDFLDTLEVKEVDFSTEIYKYTDEHFNVYDDGNQTLQTKDKKSLIGMVDVENIAKHFFELGMAERNKVHKGKYSNEQTRT